MLRPVVLSFSAAIILGLIIAHVESCYRCESGIITTKWCDYPKGKACLNEDRPIQFRQPFLSTPVIVVDIANYYYHPSRNGRMVVKPRQRTPEGFTVRMRTWEDTHLYQMNISYMACGSRANP